MSLGLTSSLTFLVGITCISALSWRFGDVTLPYYYANPDNFGYDKFIIITPDSREYCDFHSTYIPVCDFQDVNKTIVLNYNLNFKTNGLIALNSLQIKYYPTCLPAITIKNASNFTTVPYLKSHVVELSHDCTTWMTLIESNIDTLADGIENLYLLNCTVQKIDLNYLNGIYIESTKIDNIESLKCNDSKGEIAKSKISRVFHLSSTKNFLIDETLIGSIESGGMKIQGEKFGFYKSEIDLIRSSGIYCTGQEVELEDLIINQIEYNGIIIDDTTRLTMKNVHIKNASPFSFFFPVEQNVVLDNVTLNGEKLTYNSEWIEKFESTFVSKSITTYSSLCTKTGETLECNFRRMPLNFYPYLAEDLGDVSQVIVKNADKLRVDNSWCYFKNITILNSKVDQILGQRQNTTTCYSTLFYSSLHIKNSTVRLMESNAYHSIYIEKTHVHYLDLSNVMSYDIRNSTLDDIRILDTRKGSKGRISNCKMHSIENAYSNGPFKLLNSTVGIVKNWQINHPGGTSKIVDTSLDRIDYKGLYLISGHLKMKQVVVPYLVHESIYLEEKSSLEFSSNESMSSTGNGFLSVHDVLQVELDIAEDVRNLSSFYTIRKLNPDFNESDAKNEIVLNGEDSPTQFCYSISQLEFCDFQNLTNVSVTVNYSSSGPYSANLININSLTLNPWCRTRVKVENILMGRVPKKEGIWQPCSGVTSLHVSHSNFTEVQSHLDKLTIMSSTLGILSNINYIISIFIHESLLKVINGISFKSYFIITNAVVFDVEEIVAMGKLHIYESEFDDIKPMGITIAKDSLDSVIDASYIHKILPKAFTIYGKLLINNTIIHYISDSAFDIFGTLVLENVSIYNGSLSCFNIKKGGSLEIIKNVEIHFKNVTMTKNLMYVENSETSSQDSNSTEQINSKEMKTSVNLNQKNTTASNLRTKSFTPPNIIETTTQSKDEQRKATAEKRIIFTHTEEIPEQVTQSNYKLYTQTTEKKDIIIIYKNRSSWLMTTTAFFLGIACTLTALYTLFIYRTKRKLKLPLFLRWVVGTDHHQLIPSNEEEMSERIGNSSPLSNL